MLLQYTSHCSLIHRCCCCCSVFSLVVAVRLLVGEDDEELLEDSNEVNEQLNSMCNVVSVAHATLLNDHLSVVHDEPAHNKQTEVQVNLEEEHGANEDVENGKRTESAKH